MKRFADLKHDSKNKMWSVLIVALVIILITGVAVTNLTTIADFQYLEEFPRHRSQLAGGINVRFMRIQEYLSRMSVYSGFPDEISTMNQLRLNILDELDEVACYFQKYRASIENDPRFDYEEVEAYMLRLQDAMGYFDLWNTLVVLPVAEANIVGNRNRVVDLHNWHTFFYEHLLQSFNYMQAEAYQSVYEGTARVYSTIIGALIIFVGLAFVAVIVCILLTNANVRLGDEKAASRVKSIFLANMSHEIRTPITAVMGISELGLQVSGTAPLVKDYFAKINSSSRLLLGIINDLLDFSKLEADKVSIQNEKYDTAYLISDIVQPYYAYLGRKDIQFDLQIDADFPKFLVGDALRVEQVVINLLSNAFKYTEKGRVCLRISYTPDGDGASVVFVISDTGLGMTRDQLQAIFDDYTRFHEGIKTITGTGLGMSLVQRLTKLMGGTVEIESEVNVGTTVKVGIPQKVFGAEILSPEIISRLQKFEAYIDEKEVTVEYEPMPYGTVLVVDDTETNLFVAKGLLEFYSLTVDTCTSGYDAIKIIKQGMKYDLILMDSMMPAISGTETMLALREAGYTRPIVVLTAHVLTGVKEEYISRGFDDFLAKPINTKNLDDVLRRMIRDKQPREVLEKQKNTAKREKDIQDVQKRIKEKLTKDFPKTHKNDFENLTAALNTDDLKTAHRIVHTLKGVAMQIDEENLSCTARFVEGILRNGTRPSEEELAKLESELKLTLEKIAQMAVPGEDEPTAILLRELKPMLEQRQGKCLDLVPDLKAIPEATIIARQIENFDFAGALKSVKVLLQD